MKRKKIGKMLKDKYVWLNIAISSIIVALACGSIVSIIDIANIKTKSVHASNDSVEIIPNINEEIVIEDVVAQNYISNHIGEINGLKYEVPDNFVVVNQGELQLIVKNVETTYDICCVVSHNNANIKNNYNVTNTMLTLNENMANHIIQSNVIYTDDFEITVTEYGFDYPSIMYTIVFGDNIVTFYFYGTSEESMNEIRMLADTVIATLSVLEG